MQPLLDPNWTRYVVYLSNKSRNDCKVDMISKAVHLTIEPIFSIMLLNNCHAAFARP